MAYKSREVHRSHYRAVADYKRRVIARWKRIKGCVDCGYHKHPDALELDHRPGTKGKLTVASMMYRSWATIKKELSKCEVRCANCHAIKTFERKRAVKYFSAPLAELADASGLDPDAPVACRFESCVGYQFLEPLPVVKGDALISGTVMEAEA
jgi:hypothetical protein